MKLSVKRVIAVTIVTLSQITLLILKFKNIVNWSWVWVLAPIWITYVGALVVFALVTAAAIVYGSIERIRNGDKLPEHKEPGQDSQGSDYKED